AAALGVLIVDEAVYALQEMQPGLEKVYFTLQEELLKPQAQAVYKPSEGLDTLVRDGALPPARQQVAQVLLTAVKPKAPARWDVNPALERQQKYASLVQQVGWALFASAAYNGNEVLSYDKDARRWVFKSGALDQARKSGYLGLQQKDLKDPMTGGDLKLESLAVVEKEFTP